MKQKTVIKVQWPDKIVKALVWFSKIQAIRILNLRLLVVIMNLNELLINKGRGRGRRKLINNPNAGKLINN